jgi:prevent-host-death family protein
MSAKTMEMGEAQARFSELLSWVREGTEVILTERQKPVARILPIGPPPPRVAGLHAGAIWTSDDFDAPLPDEFWVGRQYPVTVQW